MKKTSLPVFNQQSSSLRGFTLIELLVVIAVIAILAAIAIPSFSFALRKIKDIESAAMATKVVQAIEALEADASILPSAWAESPASQDTDNDLLSHLMGKNVVINRTAENYLEIDSTSKKGGGIYEDNSDSSGTTSYELYDAWTDSPLMFEFAVDADGDGEIARPTGYPGAGTSALRQIAIVHSAGNDRDFSDIKDNPKTWSD